MKPKPVSNLFRYIQTTLSFCRDYLQPCVNHTFMSYTKGSPPLLLSFSVLHEELQLNPRKLCSLCSVTAGSLQSPFFSKVIPSFLNSHELYRTPCSAEYSHALSKRSTASQRLSVILIISTTFAFSRPNLGLPKQRSVKCQRLLPSS